MRSCFVVSVTWSENFSGRCVLSSWAGHGTCLRPSIDPFLATRQPSVHESRSNQEDWKYGIAQVLKTEWKLTGESDRAGGRDDLIWLWRIVILNAASFGDECVGRVTRLSLKDRRGFEVAVSDPSPQEIGIKTGAVANISGSGHLARVRMTPDLRLDWQLQTTCPSSLPHFSEARITDILETVPQDRHPSSADDVYLRMLGPVAKVRALLSSEATYIREIRNDKCENDPKCRKPTSRDDALDAFLGVGKPVVIQIQFPRGAQLRVGDTIYTFRRRHVKDAAGERSVGYGFTADGASLPLRYWSDETHTSLRGNDTRIGGR